MNKDKSNQEKPKEESSHGLYITKGESKSEEQITKSGNGVSLAPLTLLNPR
jgi:hypothetical protein